MIDKKRVYFCFLSTPFKGYEEIRASIVDTLYLMHVQPVLWECRDSSEPIAEVIQNQIARSDFIIADVTDNNPSVMFELGYAIALKIPVLLLVQNTSRNIPFNIASHLYNAYDPSQLQQLQVTIHTWVSRLIDRIEVEANES